MISAMLWFALTGPAALVVVGCMPSPRRYAGPAALLAACVALAGAAAEFACGALRTPVAGIAGLGFGIYLDFLSAMMFCLVAVIGLVVIRFCHAYLAGAPGAPRFLRWLCLTLAAVQLVIISGNFLQLAIAWIATSHGLHQLLIQHPQRQGAVLAARKKFLASRLGDVSLLAAMVLVYQEFHSLDYATVFAGATALASHTTPPGLQSAAALLALTALLGSAQFPLHGWLTEVMEAPTPLSALLHAGIINAGGFLVLRFAALICLSPLTLHGLAIVGGLTALFGSVVLLTQTSVKVSLAWSTIAQMGFMMLECGLGAFAAALLHILAHSFYKAHAFLASGSVIDIARASWTPSPGGRPHPLRLAIAIVVVVGTIGLVSAFTGITISTSPGAFTLGAVLALAQILLLTHGIDERPSAFVILRTVALSLLVTVSYFALQALIERLSATSLVPYRALRDPLDSVIAAAVILGFAAVTAFQGLLPGHSTAPGWAALHAHVSNGFYINTLTNRWVLRWWPR